MSVECCGGIVLMEKTKKLREIVMKQEFIFFRGKD
jgi:hypothetical protein